MNKKVKITLAILVLGATTLHAADSGLGTTNDPLVTKSYVDKKIAEVSGTGSLDVSKKLEQQQILINELSAQLQALEEKGSSTYEVVVVKPGEAIFGKQGSEIIVRSGEAKVIGSEAGGIQDMTAGVDLDNASLAPKYHLLIIPREDGRGLLATKTLTVMVRGGYTVQ